jgi:hypothetical protein
MTYIAPALGLLAGVVGIADTSLQRTPSPARILG